MFDSVFENLRKATDVTIQMQQELFKKWTSLWPGPTPSPTPSPTIWGEQTLKFQRKWTETVEELLKKQRESLDTQFTAGLRNLEAAFHLAEAKDLDELRTQSVELWQKSFDCLRQTFEAQARDFQAAVGKWNEVITKGAA